MGFIHNGRWISRIVEALLFAGAKCAALILLVAFWIALPRFARADAGVLIPRDKEAPDAAVLSLAEMKVDITIDNGDARTGSCAKAIAMTGRVTERIRLRRLHG